MGRSCNSKHNPVKRPSFFKESNFIIYLFKDFSLSIRPNPKPNFDWGLAFKFCVKPGRALLAFSVKVVGRINPILIIADVLTTIFVV